MLHMRKRVAIQSPEYTDPETKKVHWFNLRVIECDWFTIESGSVASGPIIRLRYGSQGVAEADYQISLREWSMGNFRIALEGAP